MPAVRSTGQPWESPGVYPATIKQLLRAERPHSQAKFSVDGIELGMVTCVASVVAIRDHGSMKAYYLEDGSAGRLRTTLFQESETASHHLGEQLLETHNYVRVVGRLDVFNHITELRATHIRPVLDMHEPFFHLLEAMVAFKLLSNEKPSPPPPAHSATGAEELQSPVAMQRHFQDIDEPSVSLGAQEPMPHDASAVIVRNFEELTLITDADSEEDWFELESPPPSPRRQPSSPSPSSPMSGDDPLAMGHRPSLRQDPYSALSSLHREIMLQIQNNDALFPEGVPIRAVFRRTVSPRSGINESEIRQAIDDLLDNGLLYTTPIDEFHFKLVD